MKLYFFSLTFLALCFLPITCSANTGSRLPDGTRVDKILVEKSKRRLTIFEHGKKLKSYLVSLGRNPKGPKEEEGDEKTPEGNYTIDYKKSDSDYHLALHISYPNKNDIKRAQKLGVSPGGAIMIHGIRNGFGRLGGQLKSFDWTLGCIAVTNKEIEELWRVVPKGTPIEIDP
jgi:murein L,D-transpeptidase YafK